MRNGLGSIWGVDMRQFFKLTNSVAGIVGPGEALALAPCFAEHPVSSLPFLLPLPFDFLRSSPSSVLPHSNDQEQRVRPMQLQFASEPGRRHIVCVDGTLLTKLQHSDLRFLRLLRLSLARKGGIDDGWLDKSFLRSASIKDREIEKLRRAIKKTPDLPDALSGKPGLIQSRKGGYVRLMTPPDDIYIDPSLRHLELLGARRAKPTRDQSNGLHDASLLLRDCQRLLPQHIAMVG